MLKEQAMILNFQSLQFDFGGYVQEEHSSTFWIKVETIDF